MAKVAENRTANSTCWEASLTTASTPRYLQVLSQVVVVLLAARIAELSSRIARTKGHADYPRDIQNVNGTGTVHIASRTRTIGIRKHGTAPECDVNRENDVEDVRLLVPELRIGGAEAHAESTGLVDRRRIVVWVGGVQMHSCLPFGQPDGAIRAVRPASAARHDRRLLESDAVHKW